MGHRSLVTKIGALQLNTAGLLSLLGGDEEDRNRFLEIYRGITTPAQWRVIENFFESMNAEVEGLQRNLKALNGLAKDIKTPTAAPVAKPALRAAK